MQELDAQTAVELPDRDMMALIIITVPVDVDVDVRNVDIGAQVCAAVLANNSPVECTLNQ